MKGASSHSPRDLPSDAGSDDPVFLDLGDAERWLDHEIREDEAPVGKPKPNRRLRRRGGWFGRLVRVAFVLALLFVAAAAIGIWFGRHWLIAEGQGRLRAQMERNGLFVEYGEATWRFPRGLVIQDVRFFQNESRDKLLFTVSDLGIVFDAVGAMRDRSTRDVASQVTLRDATLVFFREGEEVGRVTGARGDFLGSRERIEVERFEGKVGGLQVDLNGTVLQRRGEKKPDDGSETNPSADEKDPKRRRTPDFSFFEKVNGWTAIEGSGEPPRLRGKFQADPKGEDKFRIEGDLTGRDFAWKGVHVDSFSSDFSFSDAEKHLRLDGFTLVHRGRLVRTDADFDLPGHTVELARFSSSADLLAIAIEANPGLADKVSGFDLVDAPEIRGRGRIAFDDFWRSDFVADYAHWSGLVVKWENGARELPIRGLKGRLAVKDGAISTEGFEARIFDGPVKVKGTAFFGDASFLWNGRVEADGVPMNSVARFFGGKPDGFAGSLTGWYEGKLTADHAGWDGKGAFSIAEGKLYSIPLFGAVKDTFASVAPVFGTRKGSRFDGAFTIAGGVVRTDDLVVANDGTRVTAEGELNLNTMETRFTAKGNLEGPLGAVTGLLSAVLEVEGSGPVSDLK
ncbi:MAG: hypothetical protein KDM91_18835, partial [Verrucomicrobiae bacterium]|nr:hypothetical protein [Verrucomicrobiae bacterium]